MNKKNFDDKENRKKVKNDIKIYKDSLNEIKISLGKVDKKNDKFILKIEEGLKGKEKELDPKINIMEEKIRKLEYSEEGIVEELNLFQNKEYLEAKQKEEENIKKVQQNLRDIQEKMKLDIALQGDMLDEIERKVSEAENNKKK